MKETALNFLRRAYQSGINAPAQLEPEHIDSGSLAAMLTYVAQRGAFTFHGPDEAGVFHLVYSGTPNGIWDFGWTERVREATAELWSDFHADGDASDLARAVERVAVEAERLGLSMDVPDDIAERLSEVFLAGPRKAGLLVSYRYDDGDRVSVYLHKREIAYLWCPRGRERWCGRLAAPSQARAQAAEEKAQRREAQARYKEDLAAARAAVGAMSPGARLALALASAGLGSEVAALDYEVSVRALGPEGWRFTPGQMGGTLSTPTSVVSCPGALRPWIAEWEPAVEAALEEYRRAQAEREARRCRARG